MHERAALLCITFRESQSIDLDNDHIHGVQSALTLDQASPSSPTSRRISSCDCGSVVPRLGARRRRPSHAGSISATVASVIDRLSKYSVS
jgi:hypothetical protein